MKNTLKPSLGWQSWSPPFPKWHGFPRWDYAPIKIRPFKWPKLTKEKGNPKIRYWCSWYAYGWNINHDKIIATVDVIAKHRLPFTHIIIDDEWTTWGDWHTPNPKRFSNLKGTIQKIHDHKLKAGLWVAPFLANSKSQIFKDHPDWFVRYQNKLVWGLQTMPIWECFLPRQYLLNLELSQVKKYLTDFIDLAVKSWGVDLFKLDFLYAPYFNPNHDSDKLAHDQITWLFSYIKTKYPYIQTIACGAPFAPTIGLANIIRISKDTALPPEFPYFLNKLVYKSRVNMLAKKLGIIRNDPFFSADPDVRIFKLDSPKTNIIWDSISPKILGIGDDLTTLWASQIRSMKLWLKTNAAS